MKLYKNEEELKLDGLLTVQHVADYYGVCFQAVYLWIEKGLVTSKARIKGRKTCKVISLQSLEEYHGR